MSSLCVKFQPSSTPPTDRFWWGVLVVVLVLVLVVLLVTGVKQSQLLVLRLSLEFDNNYDHYYDDDDYDENDKDDMNDDDKNDERCVVT